MDRLGAGLRLPRLQGLLAKYLRLLRAFPTDRHPRQNRLDRLGLFLRWRHPHRLFRRLQRRRSGPPRTPRRLRPGLFHQHHPNLSQMLDRLCLHQRHHRKRHQPNEDTAHFAPWDYGSSRMGGPSGWPAGWRSGGSGDRTSGSYSTDSAYLSLTVTTELDNWPLYSLPLEWNAAEWTSQDPNAVGSAAAATFTYDWTFPNNYDGAPEPMKKHANQLRTHVDQLAKKEYWRQFERSPEFVVAFIPGESLLAARLRGRPRAAGPCAGEGHRAGYSQHLGGGAEDHRPVLAAGDAGGERTRSSPAGRSTV